jgi:hypothetical protein
MHFVSASTPVGWEWGQMSARPWELRVVSAAVHKLAFDPAT